MRIEVIGLPGVGKTTILRTLATECPDIARRYVRKFSNEPGRRTDWAFFLRFPLLAACALRQPDPQLALTKLRRAARRLRALRDQPDYLLHDNGPLQPLLEAFILFDRWSPPVTYWRRVLVAHLWDHDYLFIRDDIDRIVIRELQRDPRHFVYGRDYLLRKYEECDRLIESIRPHARIHDIRLGAHASLRAAVRTTREIIEERDHVCSSALLNNC